MQRTGKGHATTHGQPRPHLVRIRTKHKKFSVHGAKSAPPTRPQPIRPV